MAIASSRRAGFFIGDGAGIGKGRTLAALILENWRRGRRRHVWISISSDLKFDAKRDLEDLGARIQVHDLRKLSYGPLEEQGVDHGVVFLTYASLISANKGKQSRLEQLVEWCGGKSFAGCLLFDEAHKAKNLFPETGSEPTKTGQAVVDIQAKLPGARVVYCSATGASSARNMGYMVRLGLWGPGTAFADFRTFFSKVAYRGMGAMELVAMDMKARGMYLCRTLSFADATFTTDEVPLPVHEDGRKNLHQMYEE